ncbi:MAG: hypothetical protein IKT44_00730 [Clostridia bacterium]|nr:hypothetical protein [Clostridia bacterium]
MKRIISAIGLFGIICFGFMILKNPEICAESAVSGLILCGRVIIPSLFPFTFCVLFILKSGILQKLKIPETLCIFLLSLIGGYPLGAKMISESQIERKNTSQMLNFCVNAGPAFIILAVGNGIFSSTKIGILLFVSHIIPSLILAFVFKKSLITQQTKAPKKAINFIDNFVLSAYESSHTLINISSFVILFSVFVSYINSFSQKLPFLKPFEMVLEVTNGINQTRNIYIISSLLGFGGICIWCQVFSLSKGIKINYIKFVLCRIFHSITSCALTFLLIKIFNITVPTLSNSHTFGFSVFQTNAAVGISLILMGIVFIISLTGKNFTGNILEDIV